MKLDHRNTYSLVWIREEDEWKTACSITVGHFEYYVMQYGLSCTPSIFQCLINDMLGDMLSSYVIAYIDDILIYSPDEENHAKHTKVVLT